VQELKLLPISPRQVVLRSEAAQICYTTTPDGLATTPVANAFIPGHGGVGTVIEIGSKVNRVTVGDRVVVAGTRHCGGCYNCVRGRADHCLLRNGGGDPNAPVAEMRDGTRVTGFTPCCSELMVVFEESCVPVSAGPRPRLCTSSSGSIVEMSGTWTFT
jgi:D-arabinose 1-dehydrogenase-like Zn-dependent alcohol dehydrogenase